jgi:hypothetical protein
VEEDTGSTYLFSLDSVQDIRFGCREDSTIVEHGVNVVLDKPRRSSKSRWSFREETIYCNEGSMVFVYLMMPISVRPEMTLAWVTYNSPSEIQGIRLPLAVQEILVMYQTRVLVVLINQNFSWYMILDSFENSVCHILVVHGDGG